MEVVSARAEAGSTEGPVIHFLEEKPEPKRVTPLVVSVVLHGLALVALSLTPRSVLEPPVWNE